MESVKRRGKCSAQVTLFRSDERDTNQSTTNNEQRTAKVLLFRCADQYENAHCTQDLNSDGADLLLVIPRTLPASQQKFHGFRVLLSNMDWIKSILLCYSLYSMINKFGTIMARSTLGFHQLGTD